jgi:transcription antitermination factor NusG
METSSRNPVTIASLAPSSNLDAKLWFALYTRTHHEKRVAMYLAEREIEHFLPLYQEQHQWSHYRKVTVDLPLFPNYIFVNVARQQRIQTLEAPGAVSLVGQRNAPTPLPALEIEPLRNGLLPGTYQPHRYLAAGTQVRIERGPLAGVHGIVLRTKSGCRVVLSLDLIMRSMAVEVDASDLEPDVAASELSQDVETHWRQ